MSLRDRSTPLRPFWLRLRRRRRTARVALLGDETVARSRCRAAERC